MVQKIAQAIVRQAKEECAQDIYFVPKDDCYELYMRIGDERRFIQTYDFDQCNPHHNLDLFNHIISVVSKVPADLELKYSALLHDIAKPIVQIFD